MLAPDAASGSSHSVHFQVLSLPGVQGWGQALWANFPVSTMAAALGGWGEGRVCSSPSAPDMLLQWYREALK